MLHAPWVVCQPVPTTRMVGTDIYLVHTQGHPPMLGVQTPVHPTRAVPESVHLACAVPVGQWAVQCHGPANALGPQHPIARSSTQQPLAAPNGPNARFTVAQLVPACGLGVAN